MTPDGTIYAGILPDTGKPMYTTPADAPLTYTFNQAQKYAAEIDAHGHQDGRVPTKGELNVLYNNRTPSMALTYPVRILPVGTGRLHSTTTTMRGFSTSATEPGHPPLW